MALSTRALRIFSAVEVLREGNADIRFALAPLFQADLSKFDGEVFDPRKLADQINQQFRLNVNKDVIEELAPVFADLGWIARLPASAAAFVVTCPTDAAVAEHNAQFETGAAEIAQLFRAFITELSPLSQVNLTDSELVDALVDWLVSLDVLSEDDLHVITKVEKIGSKLVYNVTTPAEVRADDIAYLCARFVQSLVKDRAGEARFLIELAGVGLMTEVIRDFYKPSTSVNKTDLTVYLDAPVALDFLGLSGKDTKNNIRDITDKITALGGSVRIYRMSVEEMQTSLSALLARRPQDRDGPTADAMRRGEVLEAFVRQVAVKPDGFLQAEKVGIVDQDIEQFPGDHRFFTKDASDILYSQVHWVKEDVPRFHDAAVATLTMRKRRGARSNDIFDTKHVVITRNPFYPAVARRVAIEHNYINGAQIGPVVHQRQLATAVWLRAGFARSDDTIPRRYILSACRRVLTLRKNIVQKVRQVGESLSSDQAEQLELLLTQARSVQVLMDKTLGSENVIDSTNITTLVDEMKKALISEERVQSERELRRVKTAASTERSELRKALNENSVSLSEITTELGRERANRQAAAASVLQTAVRITNRSIKQRRVRWLAGAALLVAGGELLGFYGSGFSGVLQTLALVAVIALSMTLFLKEAFVPQIVDPIFKRWDEESLWAESLELALNPEVVEQCVRYEGGSFAITSDVRDVGAEPSIWQQS